MARKDTRTRQRVELIDMTLVGLSAYVDERLGRAVGFAEAVVEWRKQSDLANALASTAAYRRAVAEKIERYTAMGHDHVAGQRVVRRDTVRVTTTVRSAAVERAHPALWSQARVLTRSMAITAPATSPVLVLSVPSMPTMAEAWRVHTLAVKRCTAAGNARDAAKDVLVEAIDGLSGEWDGTPRLTTDGWTVGMSEGLRFNAARCMELAVEAGIDLSAVAETKTSVQTRYALVDNEIGDEYDEIDGQ